MIELNVAEDDADLLVVTENGYGKRTRISEYRLTGRGGLGVKTVKLTEARGQLAGARVVRDGYQVMLISTGGTVIKMPVDGIRRMGRATQGVIVMRLRGDEIVSSLAPVVESEESDDERRRRRSAPIRRRRSWPRSTSTIPTRARTEDDDEPDEDDDADDE